MEGSGVRIEPGQNLFLLPSDAAERDEWRGFLSECAWADGEFGMVLTESAFRDFCREAEDNADLPVGVRQILRRCLMLLEEGQYTDVCLETGITPQLASTRQ
jgi:hypothetical protein